MFGFAPAHAASWGSLIPSVSANGRRLIRSVCGSWYGVLISRDAQMVLADSTISLYKNTSLCLSKKISNMGKWVQKNEVSAQLLLIFVVVYSDFM